MVDLSRRAIEPEQLDEGVSREETASSLADLRFVNDWLGNRDRVLDAIRPHLHGAGRAPFRVLDVGCGSADLLVWLREHTSPPIGTVGADIKWLHLTHAPKDIPCVAADARSLPFAEDTFDVVTASLFLHHFDGPEVGAVLRELFRVVRRALIVNDLRRAFVPYAFGRLVFPLVFKSPVSVTDGLISIRRAFTRHELAAAFADAGIDVRIERTWPYGLMAIAGKAA